MCSEGPTLPGMTPHEESVVQRRPSLPQRREALCAVRVLPLGVVLLGAEGGQDLGSA